MPCAESPRVIRLSSSAARVVPRVSRADEKQLIHPTELENSVIKGFKDFLLRGNVIDLAVAVVIGTAFTALVAAVTAGLIQPIVNMVFGLLGISSGGIGGTLSIPGGQELNFGLIITAVITFMITAAVVYFIFVAPMNAAKERFTKSQEEEADEQIELLTEIRDLLRSQGRDTVDLRVNEPAGSDQQS